jgi:transposase
MIRLRDSEWERIRDHFPEENIPDGHPGRKPIPTRQVLEAVLWILNTGAQWHMLPQCYPNYKTVHRRFQAWCRSEVLRRILTDIANELRERGALDEEECFIDATFAMAKGGAERAYAALTTIQQEAARRLFLRLVICRSRRACGSARPAIVVSRELHALHVRGRSPAPPGSRIAP